MPVRVVGGLESLKRKLLEKDERKSLPLCWKNNYESLLVLSFFCSWSTLLNHLLLKQTLFIPLLFWFWCMSSNANAAARLQLNPQHLLKRMIMQYWWTERCSRSSPVCTRVHLCVPACLTPPTQMLCPTHFHLLIFLLGLALFATHAHCLKCLERLNYLSSRYCSEYYIPERLKEIHRKTLFGCRDEMIPQLIPWVQKWLRNLFSASSNHYRYLIVKLIAWYFDCQMPTVLDLLRRCCASLLWSTLLGNCHSHETHSISIPWKAFDAANAHIQVNWIRPFNSVSTFLCCSSEWATAEHIFIILELQ